MQYMTHPEFGIHPMPESALEEAKSTGWVPIDIHAYLSSKGKPVEKEQEKPIIEAPAPKRGRPFKAFSRE